MALIARYVGVDEVLECYNSKSDTPYFSVWDKSKMICQYNGEEKEEGEELLREEIERNVRNKYSNTLMLCLHPEHEERYTIKSPVVYNAAFKSYHSAEVMQGHNNPNAVLFSMQQQLNLMQSQIAAIAEAKQEEEEEEEPEESATERVISGVSTILNHPLVSNFLANILTTNHRSPSSPAQHAQALAGVEDDAEVLQCFAILKTKGLTIDHLKKLCQFSNEDIKALLKFL